MINTHLRHCPDKAFPECFAVITFDEQHFTMPGYAFPDGFHGLGRAGVEIQFEAGDHPGGIVYQQKEMGF